MPDHYAHDLRRRRRDSSRTPGRRCGLHAQDNAPSTACGNDPQSACGKETYSPEIAAHLAEHLSDESLSKREVDVLQKIAGGNRNSDIAALLFISEETVKGHVKHIMEKLGANDRTDAVAIGIRRGIIQL
jgi:DNA-binding NarL/FixJ family response regulator